jgi:hypothetical protein
MNYSMTHVRFYRLRDGDGKRRHVIGLHGDGKRHSVNGAQGDGKRRHYDNVAFTCRETFVATLVATMYDSGLPPCNH